MFGRTGRRSGVLLDDRLALAMLNELGAVSVLIVSHIAEDPGEPEVVFAGGTHSEAVRVGRTVRRVGRPWSSSVLDLLQHLWGQGFTGAPRSLGFDEQGREVLTFVEGSVGVGLPEVDEESVQDDDHWVWRDDVLVHLGKLVRRYHDAAATFQWTGHTWQVPVGQPVETICHNDLQPANVVFREGVPVALIDWEAASPGCRAADLGFAAWRWVPLWPQERSRAAGLPTAVSEKSRRLHLLLNAYGAEADLAFITATTARMRQFLAHLTALVAAGSEWEVHRAAHGALDTIADEIGWVERHATELVYPKFRP